VQHNNIAQLNSVRMFTNWMVSCYSIWSKTNPTVRNFWILI